MPFLSIFAPEKTPEIIFIVFGGLGIFLYGISLMGDSLKNLAGNKLKVLIEKATSTPVKGIITGTVVTALIQSSSATTVIVIGLISAGLMTFRQSIGVIMGAGIGTTITAFLIGIKVTDYSFLIITIGAILVLFFTRRKFHLFGEAILGFGLLFLGLELMGLGLKPLSTMDWFKNSIITMSHSPILGVLVGTGLTALVQSSSASIGVLQKIFEDPSINMSLSAALPVLLGCNIGTTITAVLASFSGTTESKQAAVFNVLFKTFGAIIFLIIIGPYVSLFTYIENAFLGPHQRITIAFAHLLFNIVTTILVALLAGYFVKFIQKILPIKKKEMMSFVDMLNEDLLISSPVLALENAKICIEEMQEKSLQMVLDAHKFLNENNMKYFENCMKLEDEVDYYDHKIHEYLMKMQSLNLSEESAVNQVVYLDTIRDVERVADHCVNLVEFFNNRYSLNCNNNQEMINDLNYFFEQIITQVKNTNLCFFNRDYKLAQMVLTLEEEIDTLEKKYRRAQLNRISCQTATCFEDVHLVDILSNLERISDHCVNVVENVIDPHHQNKEKVNSSI